MRRRERWFLGSCFLLSGATSLVLEVAWSKELSYVLGNTLYAVSTVVAAFMAGLGLGSAIAGRVAVRFRRPVRAYALLQLAIGLLGALSIPALRATPPLFQALHTALPPAGELFLVGRFGTVFLLLLVPTALMGMTLPVVIGAFARERERYDLDAGLLYGANTLGAVAGTLLAGFTLIPALGLRMTCLAAGLADLGVAGLALAIDARVGAIQDVRRAPSPAAGGAAGTPPRPPDPAGPFRAWTRAQWTVAVLFALSGAVALVYEVGWFRLLSLTLGPSVYAFSAMLAMYLAGIGIGSALAAPRVAKARGSGVAWMAGLEGALGLVGLLSLFYLNRLPLTHFALSRWTADRFGEPGFLLAQMGSAAIAVLPPCLLMGMLFPVAVRALAETGTGTLPESAVGRLYAGNTAGGILGSLAAGFLLLPAIGVWKTLVLAGIASAVLAAALAWLVPAGSGARADGTHPARARAKAARPRGPRREAARAAGALVPLLLAGAVLPALPDWDVSLFSRGLYRDGMKGIDLTEERIHSGRLLYYREGINAPVAVMGLSNGASLLISGKADASTLAGDLETQLLLGHLPVLFARTPRRVAVLGYGSGMTADAVLAHPEVEALDVIEIERAVVDASPFFECVNHDPFDDPRTRLFLADGRVHLAYTGDRYDVITSEPSNPWMAGVANLFTVDFYRIVRSRLAPGGVFAQWIQDYEISEPAFRGILASLGAVFPHLEVFRPNEGECIVLASAEPISVPWEVFRARFEREPARTTFLGVDLRSPLEIPFFLQGPGPAARDFLAGAAARNTDDNAWLEYRMPREMIARDPSRPAEGAAGLALAARGADGRLRAIAALLPGIPIAECARAMILYPFSAEPLATESGVQSDPWRATRTVLAEGMLREARALGSAALTLAIEGWVREGEAYQAARVAVTERLVPALQAPEPPSPDFLDRALADAPDLPLALLAMGYATESRGDLAAAETWYRRVLERPATGLAMDAMLNLARVALGRGDPAAAREWCARGIARNPYYPGTYALLAEIERQAGDPGAARARLAEGLRLNPGEPALEAAFARAGGTAPGDGRRP